MPNKNPKAFMGDRQDLEGPAVLRRLFDASLHAVHPAERGIMPDWQGESRIGVGEAVYCGGKTAAQIGRILAARVKLGEQQRLSALVRQRTHCLCICRRHPKGGPAWWELARRPPLWRKR